MFDKDMGRRAGTFPFMTSMDAIQDLAPELAS
jgi:hypothetical protein